MTDPAHEFVDRCLAFLRFLPPRAVARAILRTEPFAGADPLAGVYLYDGTFRDDVINPWSSMEPLLRAVAITGPMPRPASLARYYAHAVEDPRAAPRDTARPVVGGSVPTLRRDAACDPLWVGWALDAVALALAPPEPLAADIAGRLCALARAEMLNPLVFTPASSVDALMQSYVGRR